MNMFHMLQLIRKLKVAVSVLVGDDKLKLDKIETMYNDCSTIYLDEKKQKEFKESMNNTMMFLEHD